MAQMPPPGMSADPMPKDGMPSGRMPPPGTDMNAPKKGEDGKVSPDDAGVIRADQRCIDCRNYDATSGDCSKVSGSFDPTDACSDYFDAINSDEPDADDMGGAPDMDADDKEMQG